MGSDTTVRNCHSPYPVKFQGTSPHCWRRNAITASLFVTIRSRHTYCRADHYLSIYQSISSIYSRLSRSSPAVMRGCAWSAYCSTYPTQETRATAVDHADSTTPTRQHELNHTDHTDHESNSYKIITIMSSKGYDSLPTCSRKWFDEALALAVYPNPNPNATNPSINHCLGLKQ